MLKKAFILIGVLVVMLLTADTYIGGSNAYGYNKPWDQGHDSTNPNDPNDPSSPPDPPNNPCGGTGSPVYIRSGNVVKKFIDISFQACGKPIKVTRVYNSFDKHNGLFGFGWTLSYSIRLLDTRGSGGEEFVLLLMPNGQRYKFTRNADATYTSPSGTIFILRKENDTFLLEDNLNLVYTFDTDGYITKIEDKNGNEVTLTYQNFGGCLETISDENGRTLTFTFGANGKIASISDPVGSTFTYDYDANGDLVKVTDPEGGETAYSYDAQHNLLSIVNPDGETVLTVSYETTEPYRTKTYSELGETYTISYVSSNRTQKKDSLNQTSTYDFLDNGLITQVITPMSHVIAHEYDAGFNYKKFTDPNGNQADFLYDAERNMLEIQDALANKYAFTYDGKGNVLSITDPLGNTASFTYDADSSLTHIDRPIGDDFDISYDSRGYMTALTSGGETLTFMRDANCNLTKMQSSTGAEMTISYDGLGNPVSITKQGVATSYTLNKLNRITSVSRAGSTTNLSYDLSGRTTAVTFPGNNTMGYSYSSTHGRIDKISYPDNTFYQYDYYAFGQLKTLKNEAGDTTYSYDNDHRLTTVTFPSGKTVSYQYDNAKNVNKVTDSVLGVINITYDALNRVTGISDSTRNHTFTYDSNGNRLTKTEAAGTTTYTYDALSRLTEIEDPTGSSVTFSPPLNNLARVIALNDVIGLYNSKQMVRLLSYLVGYTPDQIVKNIQYDLEFQKFQHGISQRLLTGFSSYELPYPDSYSVPQVCSLIDFQKVYTRLGLGWQ